MNRTASVKKSSVSIGTTPGARPRAGREAARSVGTGAAWIAVIAGGLLLPSPATGQDRAGSLAFDPGEVLEYRVSTSRFGDVGNARMAVEGPVEVRGRKTVVLSLEVRGKVVFFSFADTTRSWLAGGPMTSLRYRKVEHHPLSSRNESVEIFPEERRWTTAEGDEGLLMTDRPLDELSFIYLARTLSLPSGDSISLQRHFDPVRNPVRISGRGLDSVSVPAGAFEAETLMLTVRDDERFGEGERGRIRIDLSTGPERIPLRIVSTQPWLGEVTMSLVAHRPGSETTRTGRGVGTVPLKSHIRDNGNTNR